MYFGCRTPALLECRRTLLADELFDWLMVSCSCCRLKRVMKVPIVRTVKSTPAYCRRPTATKTMTSQMMTSRQECGEQLPTTLQDNVDEVEDSLCRVCLLDVDRKHVHCSCHVTCNGIPQQATTCAAAVLTHTLNNVRQDR